MKLGDMTVRRLTELIEQLIDIRSTEVEELDLEDEILLEAKEEPTK